jgi:hypothetical protein
MKKFLKILGITIVVIFLLLLILPFAFKGKIVDGIKSAANENLNAKVNFEDVSLSLISNFPNLSVDIESFTVDGVEKFEGVRMADIKTFSATVDVWSLMGEQIEIIEIGIVEPKIKIHVLEDGSANYDIVKASEEPEEVAEETEEGGGFKMALQNYFIEGGYVLYDDKSMPFMLEIENLNHNGSGDLTATTTTLSTMTTADAINMSYDNIYYINKASAEIDADLAIDFEQFKFTFNENVIRLNELEVGADGWLAMPADDIDMDITFDATKTEFRTLLSMVPAEFASDLEGVDVSGKMAFDGYVKGTYNDNSMPGFGVNLMVENGRFQYPDLPKSADNIQVEAHIDAPDGNDFDKMKIDVPTFHVELGGNPIDANLKLRTPMSDPQIDTEVKAKIVLSTLKDVVPLDASDKLEGTVNADLSVHGRMSTIEQERYEDFDAKGQIILQEIMYASASMPYDVNLDIAYFNFSPQFIELSQFKSRIADSDINANGKINNYLAFALQDSAMLQGTFNLQSNNLNLNPFMADSGEEAPAETETTEDSVAMSVIEVPGDIDFVMNADIKKLTYDNVNIANMKGKIIVRDKKAMLSNLGMDVLGGQVKMSGTYDTQNPERPEVDFDFGITNLDIQATATTFNTADKLAPIAKNCTGKFSTQMKFMAALDTTMAPINETIQGGGTLSTNDVFIEGFEPLNKLAAQLKIDRLAKQNIQDISIKYKFEDGKVTTEPFEVKLDGMPATVDGYTTFEQEINYNVAMDIPFEKLGSTVNQQASNLLGQMNDRFGTNLSAGQTIPVRIKIVGTVTDPKFQTNFGELGGSSKDIKEQVKEEVKEKVEEKIEEVKDDALEKAQEKADQIMAEAQEQADKIVSEAQSAAQKIREEGEKKAKQIEDEAKNPLQKAAARAAADKVRKEADKKADQLEAEAQKQADNVIAEAQQRADNLIEEAKNK